MSAPANSDTTSTTCTIQSTRQLRVSPDVPRPSEPIRLGPNDWVLPSAAIISMVFFYKCPEELKSTPEKFLPPEKLADALERLLAIYPHLCGKLVKSKHDDGTLDLEGFESFVPFVSAESTTKISELNLSEEKYVSTRSLPSSLSLIQTMNYADPLSCPLYAVQHTRFSDGGVCLGIYMSHVIGDAHSYFMIIRDWVDLYQSGGSKLSRSLPPQLDRTWSIPSAEQIAERVPAGHVEKGYAVPPEGQPPPEWWSPAPSIAKMFRFQPDELHRIKQAAQAPGQPQVSTFEALAAHLLRLVHVARRKRIAQVEAEKAGKSIESPQATPDTERKMKLLIATNFRRRNVDPSCTSRYFGNAALWTACERESKDLLTEGSLPETSQAIRSAILENDAPTMRRTLAWITSQPDKSRVHWSCLGRKDLFITQWNKMHAYSGSCFERGIRPVRVCTPASPGMDGAIILFGCPDEPEPGESHEGHGTHAQTVAIDVCLGLEEPTMVLFEANSEFRKYQKAHDVPSQ